MADIGWVDLIYPKEQQSIQKAIDKLNKKNKKDAKKKEAEKNDLDNLSSRERSDLDGIQLPDDLIYPPKRYIRQYSP